MADDQTGGAAGQQQQGQQGQGEQQGGAGDGGRGQLQPGDPNYRSERERELAAEAAKYRRELADTKDRLDKLERERQSEHERAIEDARREEREALEAKHRRELVELRVIALAGQRFADGRDALPHMDVDALLVHDAGKLDEAIERELEALLERKPYLAGDGGKGSSGLGLGTGGVRGEGAGRQGSGEGSDGSQWLRKGLSRR